MSHIRCTIHILLISKITFIRNLRKNIKNLEEMYYTFSRTYSLDVFLRKLIELNLNLCDQIFILNS